MPAFAISTLARWFKIHNARLDQFVRARLTFEPTTGEGADSSQLKFIGFPNVVLCRAEFLQTLYDEVPTLVLEDAPECLSELLDASLEHCDAMQHNPFKEHGDASGHQQREIIVSHQLVPRWRAADALAASEALAQVHGQDAVVQQAWREDAWHVYRLAPSFALLPCDRATFYQVLTSYYAPDQEEIRKNMDWQAYVRWYLKDRTCLLHGGRLNGSWESMIDESLEDAQGTLEEHMEGWPYKRTFQNTHPLMQAALLQAIRAYVSHCLSQREHRLA